MAPIPTRVSKALVGSLDFYPVRPPDTSLGWCHNMTTGGSGLSPLSSDNEATSLVVSEETTHMKSRNIHPGPGLMFSNQLWLPLWLRWQRICLQCGRPRFNPWAGNTPWRRKWHPTSVFLLGEFHRSRSLVGYIQSTGSQMVSHNWRTNTTTVRIMNKIPPLKCQWRLSGGPEILLTKKNEWSIDTCNNFFFLNWSTVSLQCFR